MQLALPCLLYAPAASKLILRGGTNAEMAPPVDFMTDVSCQSLFMRSYIKFVNSCWLAPAVPHQRNWDELDFNDQ